MTDCGKCGKYWGQPNLCNGDGRLHHHSAVHTFEGDLTYLCIGCWKSDKQKWVEAEKGWVGYGRFQR